MHDVSPGKHHQAKALLGTIENPDALVSKMPKRYETISAYRLQKKNAEQLRI
ncbi:hypothetical protein RSK20926_19272 [Roseobacter sp. SK209-2-6]|uniref:hypothetical protein n=1 Tax=Roseobacter sp. SK209-2-6 TaxID=388739 RepID=UPI0000F3F853|nr:hypothetical protein [Roseobacter sp. SK209-2-6]EBA17911.1 hypothetical protein RSK20926_19272 [Roseobacter sp. SK209-2-6]